MNTGMKTGKATAGLAVVLLVLMIAGSVGLFGCAKKLDGEIAANQKPIVYFVNIPPEGQSFSRNPVVYWYGTDNDGLIDYYRWHVAVKSYVDSVGASVDPINGANDPQVYINYIKDNPETWTIADVDPTIADPQTTHVLPLVADSNNSVINYVDQYIFLQAYDEEGLGSDIAVRLFSRNDNPPQTAILGFGASLPFVNSVDTGGIITGVTMRWLGTDDIDYPSDPPPFEFEWRFYGPYSDAEYAELTDKYFDSLFVTTDGRLFKLGDMVEICDTFVDEFDTTRISCNTIEVTETAELDFPPGFGSLEDWWAIDSVYTDSIGNQTGFAVDSLNRLVEQSGDGVDTWVYDTETTIYNVYRNFPTDTTTEMNFVFWVRSRDDALVPDLVPAFTGVGVLDPINVIEPKYERDILLVNYMAAAGQALLNTPTPTTLKAYWDTTLSAWYDNPDNPSVRAHFDIDKDYLAWGGMGLTDLPLKELLKHNVVIMYNDGPLNANFLTKPSLFTAIDGGVNAWLTMRSPVIGGLGIGFRRIDVSQLKNGMDYIRYFGVLALTYSGWMCSSVERLFGQGCPDGRIEDFIGTYSIDTLAFPDLEIDTARLHALYDWQEAPGARFRPYLGWYPLDDSTLDPIGALPEVDWCVRLTPGTDLMYLYKSKYGPSHPFGFQYSFNGAPVAHRFDAGAYRTVHMNFTPLAIKTDQMNIIVDTVLNWLYDPVQVEGSGVVTNRRAIPGLGLSVPEARKAYRDRQKRQAIDQGNSIE